MAQLLVGGAGHNTAVLTDLVPGPSPAIVVTPEYAFGHGDWAELDALVRQQQRPLVLIAGFGATVAATVEAWAQEEGATTRRLTWNAQTAQLSAVRPVNGAWCWIHGFGLDTTCVVFLKNHMEQGTELVALEWIQSGSHLLRVSFEDLDLFPLICADMVQTFAEGDATAVHRVRAALQGEVGGKPALITGSLLQGVPSNPNWAVAVDNWLNQATLGRAALVALSNISVDQPVFDEEQDSWRSLTGVFGRMTVMPHNQTSVRVARGVGTPSVRGSVLRTTAPYAAGGQLSWGPHPVTGDRFYWQAGMGAPIDGGGFAVPVDRPPTIECTELARFTRRVPAEQAWCPRVGTGLNLIRTHVESGAPPEGEELLTSLLRGVSNDGRCAADQVAREPHGSALRQGLHSLATLVSEDAHFGWRTDQGKTGQLTLGQAVANVLVWRDPSLSGLQMKHALGAWAQEPEEHPPLLVLAAGPHGQLPEGTLVGHPRDNIEAAPDSAAALSADGGLADDPTDITQRRALRSVACVSLERVTDLYVNYEADEDAARMAALVDYLTLAAQAA